MRRRASGAAQRGVDRLLAIQREVRLDLQLHGGEALLLEGGDLGLRERLERQAGQRGRAAARAPRAAAPPPEPRRSRARLDSPLRR
jgi:hypothetical protein